MEDPFGPPAAASEATNPFAPPCTNTDAADPFGGVAITAESAATEDGNGEGEKREGLEEATSTSPDDGGDDGSGGALKRSSGSTASITSPVGPALANWAQLAVMKKVKEGLSIDEALAWAEAQGGLAVAHPTSPERKASRKEYLEVVDTSAADIVNIMQQGWLVKQGGGYKSWKRRWVVLSSDSKLCYYVDPTMKKMKGSLDMSLCSDVIAGERCKCKWPDTASLDLIFGMVFKGNERVYHWYTEEEATMGGWMDALAKSLKLGPDAQLPVGRPFITENQQLAGRQRELEAKRAREAAEAADAARKHAEAEIAKLLAERDAARESASAAKATAETEEKRRAEADAKLQAQGAELEEAAAKAAAEVADAKAKAAAEAKVRAELEAARAAKELEASKAHEDKHLAVTAAETERAAVAAAARERERALEAKLAEVAKQGEQAKAKAEEEQASAAATQLAAAKAEALRMAAEAEERERALEARLAAVEQREAAARAAGEASQAELAAAKAKAEDAARAAAEEQSKQADAVASMEAKLAAQAEAEAAARLEAHEHASKVKAEATALQAELDERKRIEQEAAELAEREAVELAAAEAAAAAAAAAKAAADAKAAAEQRDKEKRRMEKAKLSEADMKAAMLERQRRAEDLAEAAALAKVSAEAKKKAAAAMRALAKITAKDISYVKVLKKPPIMIQRVMDVVAILFNGKLEQVSIDKDHKDQNKPSWFYGLKMLTQPRAGLIKKIQAHKFSHVTPEMVEMVDVYLSAADYTKANAKHACGKIAAIAEWTIAIAEMFRSTLEVQTVASRVSSSGGGRASSGGGGAAAASPAISI